MKNNTIIVVTKKSWISYNPPPLYPFPPGVPVLCILRT